MAIQKIFKPFLAVISVLGWVGSAQAALFNSPCVDELTGQSNGCTANDIAVQDIQIVWVGDGCTGPTDTAIVRMDVTLSTANPDRYDPGIYINTKGSPSAVTATGGECLHEALYPLDNALFDYSSGVGPFKDLDGDLTGDMYGSETVVRSVTQGDIGDANQSTLAEFEIACADNDDGLGNGPNGYVDFAWAVSYSQNANTIIGTSIIDTVPGAKSKCTSGISDTKGTLGSITIGIPDLSVQISCSPTTLDIGDTTTCTATYSNGSTIGPADFMKFKVVYPSAEGSITSTITKSDAAESAVDDTAGIIDWTMSGGQTNANIPASTTNTITFDYTYTGGTDFNITLETYYDNGTDPENNQNLSATATFTTLPVTIAYVDSSVKGDQLSLNFQTASETANIGFNVYAVDGNRWIRLNEQPIAGAIDSFEPISYDAAFTVPEGMKLKKIGIAGVDKNGNEDRHGPFIVGKKEGSMAEAEPVDWGKVKKQMAGKSKQLSALTSNAFAAATVAKSSMIDKKTLKNYDIYFDVAEEGVYRVTNADLLAAGIDLEGIKTDLIAVSLKGNAVARHIENDKKGRWNDQSSLTFGGVPPEGEESLYTGINRYKLTISKKRMLESDTIKPLEKTTEHFETNKVYSNSLPQEDPFYDAYLYSRGVGDDGKLTRIFEMPLLPEGSSTLTLYLSGYSDGAHEISVLLNNTVITTETAEGWTAWTIDVPVDNALFKSGSNTLQLVIPNRTGVFDFVIYDKLTIEHATLEPVAVMTPAIAVDEKIKRSDLKPADDTTFVIVSHPFFIGDVLQRYVTARESEGWKVQVVNVEDLYKAYGYGMQTPEALEKYFRAIKGTAVSHILLVGASTYDYRDYLGTGAVSFIPSAYAWTGQIIHYTPCDTCLIMDKKELPRFAIGRWPVRTQEELASVIDKTLVWKSSGQCNLSSALLIGDKTDKGMVFGDQMNHMEEQLASYGISDIANVYLDETIKANGGSQSAGVSAARTSIAQALSSGAALTSYSGHSSPQMWSFYGLLKQNDLATIQNGGKTTIALPLACFSTYADSPYTNTMAHQMLAAGENGAVAVYGATMRSSYGDNETASKAMIEAFMNGRTLGQAVEESKRLLGSRYDDLIKNNNLLGDPTLKACRD